MARPGRTVTDCGWEFSEKFSEKSQKIVKFSKKIVEIFQKIAEIFQKIVEKFQKNSKKPTKTSQNLSFLPINLRATLKVFLRALPNPLSKP